MFSNRPPAEAAVKTVWKYPEGTGGRIKVIFNVFKDEELLIFRICDDPAFFCA